MRRVGGPTVSDQVGVQERNGLRVRRYGCLRGPFSRMIDDACVSARLLVHQRGTHDDLRLFQRVLGDGCGDLLV